MEISDNDANVTTPSKGLNDHVYTLQRWVPKCDQQLKPVVGNVFDTLEEGNNFYTTYALEVGFNICRSIEVKYKDGEIKFKYYVCSRQGFKEENRRTISVMLVDEKRMPKTRRRKETREDRKYKVFRFYEGHKHALATPTKKQFLKSARNVNNVHKNLLLCFDKANVVPSKACQIMNSKSKTFGAALLVNEKAESFEWLFETFLKAMGGHKLVVIITNQDPDMKIAMKKVFTSVSPKFCIWHILKKLSEKLRASLNANTDFHSHFKSCVSNLESSKEFELTWKAIICDFKLEENG
ncbi:Protein FAR1-RELATED SEQUENCE 5 [Glycine max]|nr:Protein FAR1-RELATED SEQUENCE 5 [Glycine max]